MVYHCHSVTKGEVVLHSGACMARRVLRNSQFGTAAKHPTPRFRQRFINWRTATL